MEFGFLIKPSEKLVPQHTLSKLNSQKLSIVLGVKFSGGN